MMSKSSETGSIPLHLEIADTLKREIETGSITGGEKFHSESQLCKRFKTNRYSIRQALDQLVKMGLLQAHQGKGHYVCEQPHELQFTVTPTAGFSTKAGNLGLEPSAELINQEKEEADHRTAELLGLTPGEEIWRLDIVRYANGIPLTYSVTRLPAAFFPDLLEHTEPFHSLYTLLEQLYHIKPVRSWSTFQAVHASIYEARHLQMSPNENLLLIESIMKDERGRAVLYTSTKYRGSMSRIRIDFEM
jgi:GntR family transcriptional regulator